MAEPKPLASLTSGLLARKGGARPAMRRQPLGSGPVPPGGGGYDDLGWNDMGYDVDPARQGGDDAGPAMDLKHLMAGSLASPSAEAAGDSGSMHGHASATDWPDDMNPDHREAFGAAPDAQAWEPGADRQDQPNGDAAEGATEPANAGPGGAPEGGDVIPLSADEPPLVDHRAVPPVVQQQSILATRVKNGSLYRPAEPLVAVPPPAAERRERSVAAPKSKAAFTLRLDPARHLQLRLASALFNKSSQQILIDVLDDYLAALPQLQGLANQYDDSVNQPAATAATRIGNSQ